jgi:hypothetical protein
VRPLHCDNLRPGKGNLKLYLISTAIDGILNRHLLHQQLQHLKILITILGNEQGVKLLRCHLCL